MTSPTQPYCMSVTGDWLLPLDHKKQQQKQPLLLVVPFTKESLCINVELARAFVSRKIDATNGADEHDLTDQSIPCERLE